MATRIPQLADTVIVLDFETTGLSPDQGDRAIEIGAVCIEQGQITDHFQGLMNPGMRISSFIESYTGISNAMLKKAPPCEEVMEEFAEFVGDHNLVAHNASFDRRFLEAEWACIGSSIQGQFACSMLSARRLYQDAPNHKLGTLVQLLGIENDGTFHRALADASMTAHLWLNMLADMQERYGFGRIPFSVMQDLARTPKANTNRFLKRQAVSYRLD